MGSFISDRDESNFLTPDEYPDMEVLHYDVFSSSPDDRKRFLTRLSAAMELEQGFRAWSFRRLDSTIDPHADEWAVTSSVSYGLEVCAELASSQMLERLEIEAELDAEFEAGEPTSGTDTSD